MPGSVGSERCRGAYADKVISFEVAVCDEPFEKQTNGGYEEISEKYGYIAHRFNLP